MCNSPDTLQLTTACQVQAMYIYETETWYSSLAVHDLLDLARVSDCLDCSDIMKLCRKTLVAKCKVAADPVVVFDALEAASQLRMAGTLHPPAICRRMCRNRSETRAKRSTCMTIWAPASR